MADRMHEVLCWNCRKKVSYRIKAREEEKIIKGNTYHFNEKYAVCDICGEEIMVPGLDDENDREIDNIFRRQNDLITIDEIVLLMKKYNIEKRPLSKLLGLGEITITRYLDGQLPAKKYSDMLKRVLCYDEAMTSILESGRGMITDNAYKKVEESIKGRKRLWGHSSKIEIIALYIIDSVYDITNLSLQKLLYYYKAMGYVFYNKDMLEEGCEAWVHGPVFTKIYDKYKFFGRETIINEFEEWDYSELLTPQEIDLCDYVLRNFAIYNGGILREFTHKELPWLEAREGLGETERCTNVIKETLMYEYFNEMNKKYGFDKSEGIANYIKSLDVI